MPTITIKPGREKSLHRHHPWLFSGAIENESDHLRSGETISILSNQGEFLAQAAYSPHSQIRARVWTYNQDEKVDKDFFKKRICAAISLRQILGFFSPENRGHQRTACRLIHAESDDLPGLIIDQYGETLVAQFLTTGVEYWKETLVDLLVEFSGIENLYERSDAEARQLEGLPITSGPLRGNPPEKIIINENGINISVDITSGHKTGFYLDQRINRLRVRSFSRDRSVLDCFCYTGGFTLNALSGGAKSVVSVDASAEALIQVELNMSLNKLPKENVDLVQGDVFQLLRKFRDSRRTFDLIVLDPPKFAQTSHQVEQAARGYKDINLLAFKLLNPGGILITFSCSGGINPDLFQKIVSGAALDAGVSASIIEVLSQAGDHPIGLNFPEGAYLKGLICVKQ